MMRTSPSQNGVPHVRRSDRRPSRDSRTRGSDRLVPHQPRHARAKHPAVRHLGRRPHLRVPVLTARVGAADRRLRRPRGRPAVPVRTGARPGGDDRTRLLRQRAGTVVRGVDPAGPRPRHPVVRRRRAVPPGTRAAGDERRDRRVVRRAAPAHAQPSTSARCCWRRRYRRRWTRAASTGIPSCAVSRAPARPTRSAWCWSSCCSTPTYDWSSSTPTPTTSASVTPRPDRRVSRTRSTRLPRRVSRSGAGSQRIRSA